ncbi:unnamed protein product [Protopolystoma xenopodis]|uniref:Uncharacterized protein n=1 Tax=Protopolystoma xenopodis TaxID=117903 RepID=A0A448XJS7_9PLAT|nr:unnamed protein product [Protopolystoma xenopodis]
MSTAHLRILLTSCSPSLKTVLCNWTGRPAARHLHDDLCPHNHVREALGVDARGSRGPAHKTGQIDCSLRRCTNRLSVAAESLRHIYTFGQIVGPSWMADTEVGVLVFFVGLTISLTKAAEEDGGKKNVLIHHIAVKLSIALCYALVKGCYRLPRLLPRLGKDDNCRVSAYAKRPNEASRPSSTVVQDSPDLPMLQVAVLGEGFTWPDLARSGHPLRLGLLHEADRRQQ